MSEIKLWIQNAWGYVLANKLKIAIFTVCLVVGFLAAEWVFDRYPSWAFWSNRQATLEAAEKFEQEAKDLAVKAAAAEEREIALGNQNKLLRAQYEKQAEILKSSGSAEAKKAAENLDEITKDFGEKLIEIEKTSDGEQKCALCADAKAIGIKFDFCGDCTK